MNIIIFSMLIMAIIGGTASFIREGDFKFSQFIKCILYSIIAVSAVPLFLNLISSNIVSSILELEGKKIMYSSYYLVFIGFCGLASIYANNFVNHMYNKITEDVNKMNNEIKEIQDQFIEKNINTDAIQEQLKDEKEAEQLLNILECIFNSKYKFRTLKGINRELKSSPEKLEKQLNELFDRGLIMKKTGKSGVPLFGISNKGLKILNV